MSKNTSLEALREHLFEALEGVNNLQDPEASECEKTSIEQAKAIVDVADAIIDTYKVQLDGVKIFQGFSLRDEHREVQNDLGLSESRQLKP